MDVVRRVTAAALVALSLLVIVLSLADSEGVFRLLAVVAFGLTAPGWAVVAFWRPANPSMEWAISICLSIAILVVLSMTMLLLSAWSPVPVFVGLAAVTAGVLVFHLVTDRNHAHHRRSASDAMNRDHRNNPIDAATT